ncbi:MAG: SDR family oxidoreductase [Rhizobiaceae bacterium]|nr:SDR family oxidoreductase [Rhizobiaceae bacterium]
MSKQKKVCLVVGAGDATGGAIAKRFAREGYVAVPVRRKLEHLDGLANEIREAGGEVVPIGCDARQEDQIIALFDRIENEIGELEVVVFNIGANVRFPFEEIEVRKFTKIWELACFAGFLTCREAARRMSPRGKGSILVTGASASVRGYAGGAAFGSAKFALRGMTQALARELWGKGIHVAHFIIDGAIDTEWIKEIWPKAYEKKDQDGILDPEHIAENYWNVHDQPRDSWTFEMDLRPWMENF